MPSLVLDDSRARRLHARRQKRYQRRMRQLYDRLRAALHANDAADEVALAQAAWRVAHLARRAPQ
jgi:hypothetical protein